MTQRDAREELVAFLDRRALQPVLQAKTGDLPASERDEPADLQEGTRAEIARFRSYDSAEEVVTNLRRDLHSGKAKEVQRRIAGFGLPTLPGVREEFEALADRLGAKGSSG